MRQLTQKQRADVVVWYLKRRSFKDARRRYRRVHRSRPPSKRTIWKWVQRFGAVGSVANKKHVFASTPEKEQLAYGIMGAFEADPHLSTKRAASLFGVSDYTLRRILCRHNRHACESVDVSLRNFNPPRHPYSPLCGAWPAAKPRCLPLRFRQERTVFVDYMTGGTNGYYINEWISNISFSVRIG